MKTYYKVVSDEAGVLKSAMTGYIGTATVEYELNKWVAPKIKGSKLFCFATLKKAREYIKDLSGPFASSKTRILRCKVKNPIVGIKFAATLDQASILYFWGKGDRPNFYYDGFLIDGVYADQIMLTKEVKT